MKLTACCILAIFFLMHSLTCACQSTSKSIRDIHFDQPYSQIESSRGDNWTPTWARDDVLYTGSDDGENFGGMAFNAVAFGKLEGSDPYHLRGTTITGLNNYREGPLFESINRLDVGGVTYQLQKCRDTGDVESTCLISLSGSKRLFTSQTFSSPHFIVVANGAYTSRFGIPADEYAVEFGALPDNYVLAAAPAGVYGGEEQYLIGKVLSSKLPRGEAADWTFLSKDGSWTANADTALPIVNARFMDTHSSNWKITSTYSVDGSLYMFITRLYDYKHSGDPDGRLVLRDASIVKSSDGGHTWTRSPEENLRAPLFRGQRFGAPYFVWYGKDGVATTDNADKYIYAISNDGYWESGDNYILGRVLRSKLANLSAADWSFFQSGDGMKDESWTHDMSKAQPILSDLKQAGMTGVTYIGGLSRYIMVSWHYPSHGLRDVEKNGDTYTVLEFFEASRPWGPWTQFKTLKTEGLGWYTPIVGQRFQTVTSPATVHAFLYTAAFNMDSGNPERDRTRFARYKLNYIPVTLSTRPIVPNERAMAMTHKNLLNSGR